MNLFSELTQINVFFSEKLAEATRKMATLKGQLFSDEVKLHSIDAQ